MSIGDFLEFCLWNWMDEMRLEMNMALRVVIFGV